VQCERLTDSEIEESIQKTAAALNAVRQHVGFLAQGRVFPHDPSARNQMMESHHKAIENLEKDMEDLLAARAKSASMTSSSPSSPTGPTSSLPPLQPNEVVRSLKQQGRARGTPERGHP
jgi:hypothetical protein